MDTPIADFIRRYAAANSLRLHMPGHKGTGPLGCENLDITEIAGADALYEADGIIAASEANASQLFGSDRTLYSTEGSSQCIRAIIFLAVTCRSGGTPPVIVAARNAHKSFIYAAALCGAEVVWLQPEEKARSICSCPVTAEGLARVLQKMQAPPCGVYVTSPDYLGNLLDLPSLADVCREFHTPLLVDHAHGAYLRFLQPSQHPLSCGAAACCESAHKTLPVLTGGAYLHIAADAPSGFAEGAKNAMALFGSTSPSYLTLMSLDECNRRLSEDYPALLAAAAVHANDLRRILHGQGWDIGVSDPLHLTIYGNGLEMAQRLRSNHIEPEYAGPDALVLLLSPETAEAASTLVPPALGQNDCPSPQALPVYPVCGDPVMDIRQAIFSPHEVLPISQVLNRICSAPTVSCPPAVPIAVSGERISEEMIRLFRYYGVKEVEVVKE